MAQRSTDLPAIEAEIERIRSLGLDALRARWRSMYRVMPPMALTKDLLVRMLTYRIQEEAFGGLDPRQDLSNSLNLLRSPASAVRPPRGFGGDGAMCRHNR